METEADLEEERALEVEDFDLSDVEETHNKESEADPISIDYNSRISSTSYNDPKLDDARIYENVSNTSRFQFTDRDLLGDTSCEELEVSDEDMPRSDFVNVQRVILDGICCFASNRHSDAASSYNYSTTNFKEDCVTDAEYVSEDDTNVKIRGDFGLGSVDRPNQGLHSGLSIGNVVPSGKDGVSINGVPLTSLNIANSYSSSIMLERKTPNKTGSSKAPLMTCLEFLKSEPADEPSDDPSDEPADDGTDVEEFSIDLNDSNGIDEGTDDNPLELPQNNGSMGGNTGGNRGTSNFFDAYKGRKSSFTTELLVEDDSPVENGDPTEMRVNRRRLSNAGDYTNDCPTDEEEFDLLDLKEWTETDESGDIRQITQIKTETSIKLEGDGDGSAFDSDDLVSTTTATTTTRVVTSVITDPDDGNDVDSTFVQQVSEDGIRQSCEITFSEVLNDSSTSQPGESGCEE